MYRRMMGRNPRRARGLGFCTVFFDGLWRYCAITRVEALGVGLRVAEGGGDQHILWVYSCTGLSGARIIKNPASPGEMKTQKHTKKIILYPNRQYLDYYRLEARCPSRW